MDFYLSTAYKEIIEEWKQQTTKYLFISGDYGIGKTSLAHELINTSDVIHITSDMIKTTDMYSYLLNIISRKSIQMMFSNKSESKTIIIDDLDVFYTNDKQNFTKIIDVLKLSKSYKIIIIFHKSIIDKKVIKSLLKKHYLITIKYTQNNIYEIIDTITDKKLQKQDKDKLLKISNGNIRSLQLNIDSMVKSTSAYDIKYEYREILTMLYTNKTLSISDIIYLSYCDYSVHSLNMLENINHFNPIHLDKIYKSYCVMDVIDTFCVSSHRWEFIDYSLVNSLIYTYMIIKNYNYNIKPPLLYNKYISKSILSISSKNIMVSTKKYPIYMYFDIISKNKKNKTSLKYMNNLKHSYITNFLKPYNWLYDQKLSKKELLLNT